MSSNFGEKHPVLRNYDRGLDGGILKFLGRLQNLRLTYHELVNKDRNRENLWQLVDYLIGSSIVSIRQIEKETNLGSYTMIQRYMEKLEGFGIQEERTGKSRNKTIRSVKSFVFLVCRENRILLVEHCQLLLVIISKFRMGRLKMEG